jgi:outer membrane receptor protein involved in Fe transport
MIHASLQPPNAPPARWHNLFIALLVALAPALAMAQSQSSRLAGKVVDAEGAPMPGVTVEAVSSSTDLQRVAVTDAQGAYLLPSLPLGSYQVVFSLEGWEPQTYEVQLALGQTVPLNVTLAQGTAVTDQITVTAPAAVMESTESGQNFNYERQVERLPILNRDFETVASYSPNITFGPTAGTISIAGAPSFDTTVLLDGAEVSDPYFGSSPDLITHTATDEVQILTSGLSARWGRFQGGIINAVTKSGTNNLSGSLTLDLEKDSWNEATPHDETLSDDLAETYQITIGGPIAKDKAWYFGSAYHTPVATTFATTVGSRETYSTPYEEDRYQFKLTAALNPSHLVDATYAKFESESTDRAGLFAGDGLALGFRRDPRDLYTASYSGVLSPNNALDVRATKKDVQIFEGGKSATRDPFIDYFQSTVYNNGWWDGFDPSDRSNETASASLTHDFQTGRIGDHLVEGGVQWVESTTGGDNRQSATGYNLLALNSNFFAGQVGGQSRFNLESYYMYRWVAIGLGAAQDLENTAAYVQDQWKVNDRLRFDIGLRYEEYNGTSDVPLFGIDFDGWAPRLGATLSLREDTQVAATWGRYIARFNDNVGNAVSGVSNAPRITQLYTGPTLSNLTADEVQAILRNDDFWLIPAGIVDPAVVEHQTTFTAADIEAPYADEFGLSVRHALPSGRGSLVLQYIHRDYENLLDDFSGAVCEERNIPLDRPCQSIIQIPEFNASFDASVWANNPTARRKYDALSLIGDVAITRNLRVSGNYTYAITKGNYEGEATNQPAIGSVIGDLEQAVRGNPATVYYPYGYTDDDLRHRLNVLGTYSFLDGPLDGLTLGSIFQYRSGLAWSKTATVNYLSRPQYVSDFGGSGNYTHYFDGRGNERFDGFWHLDLSARYDFKLFRELDAFVRAMAYNATNEDTLFRHQVTGRAVNNGGQLTWAPNGTCNLASEPSRTCSSFGRIRNELDYQQPRTYQFTVGLTF